MMKKIIFLTLLSLFTWGTMTKAQQQNDPRTLNTRVADLLLKLPAKDSLQLKTYMEEIRSMGENGLVAMISMLSPIGEGDNSSLEYAIGGFSFYATQNGREDWREIGVKAYCQGLVNLNDRNNQAFIMAQLEKVGKEDAVLCLQDFLNDEALCDPAVRALSNIQSPQANEALLEALNEVQGNCRIPLVKALGKSQYQGAIAAITPLVEDQDRMLQKAALFALAQIADPASGAVLKKAAEKTGFTYEGTEATAAYLTYAGNLIKDGNQKQAARITKYLIKNADQDDQIQYRSAALNLWVTIQGEASVRDLMAALKSDNKEYRVMALNLASGYVDSMLPKWLKKLKSSNAEVQVEIIHMLANSRAKEALPHILKAIESHDRRVRLAAISAAADLGDEQIFDNLLFEMEKGGKDEVEAVKHALFILPGNSLVDKVAEAVPSMPADAQAALIAVLAHRGAHHHWKTVSPYLESSDPIVRMAAFEALKNVTSHENLPELFTLLKNSTKNEETINIQEAIIAVLPGIEGQSEAVDLVLNQMESVPSNKKVHFYKILASVGGRKSLESLSTAFWNGEGQTQKVALDALSSLSEHGVADELYRIFQEKDNEGHFDQAFNSYIRVISQSTYPEAQKLLLLRKSMKSAKTTSQKGQVLGEIGKINTYPALVFAGKFLGDSQLQKEAANSVSNIALSNKEFHGAIVRELLEQVQAIQGASAGYQKEFMRQHLDEMPSGEGFVSFEPFELSAEEKEEGFKVLFNGSQMDHWTGNTKGYIIENGNLVVRPEEGSGGNLFTKEEFGDFDFRFEFRLTPGANNGLGIRAPLEGGASYEGMEVQILDNTASIYKDLEPYQYHGSAYGILPAERGHLKPVGEWNYQEVIVKGPKIKVVLNGKVILDGDLTDARENGTMDGLEHPGIYREKGHIGFLGHGSEVWFRNIRVKDLNR
ncbi:MAG: DUF1080 domain-containing protein [Anditalea sp.]